MRALSTWFARAIATALACSCGHAVAQTSEPLTVQGELAKDSRWQGVVRITGDITVPAGGRLEIAPGTKVLIADQDAAKAGWDELSVEWYVRGQLLVNGTMDQPVLITLESAAADAGKATADGWNQERTWHGITLFASSDAAQNRDHIRGMQLEHAMSGVQVPDADPLIEDCVFRNCGIGVEVGSLWAERTLISHDGCGPAGPEIRRCRFTAGHTGVSVADRGVPVIEFCVFHRVEEGVSTMLPGLGLNLDEPGSTVHHCLFSECRRGVRGCSLVRDSVFLGCQAAMTLGGNHERHGTEIEHMVSETCLVSGCQDEILGDTAVARDILRGEPRLRGPIDDLNKHWPPLPACLELADGSAAIGAAQDGSDLGPIVGQRQRSGPQLPWTGRVLMGFRAASCEPPGGWQKLAKPELGTAVGKSWWVVADQGPDGLVGLRRVFGFGKTVGLLVFQFDCAAAGQLPLEFSADAMKLEIAVNGAPVVTAAQRQRFGAISGPVQVKVRAGTNVLLVHTVAFGPDPFFGVALGGDWTQTPAAPVAEAASPPILRGKSVRLKEGVFLEATLTATSHWTSAPGQDLARVKPVAQVSQPAVVDVVWTGPGKLRLGPLPAECRKGEIEVTLPGLRDLTGKPMVVEPLTVKVL